MSDSSIWPDMFQIWRLYSREIKPSLTVSSTSRKWLVRIADCSSSKISGTGTGVALVPGWNWYQGGTGTRVALVPGWLERLHGVGWGAAQKEIPVGSCWNFNRILLNFNRNLLNFNRNQQEPTGMNVSNRNEGRIPVANQTGFAFLLKI